jgi:murein DD-endopeptidase MepM/ murein hydrolase activator NlpD
MRASARLGVVYFTFLCGCDGSGAIEVTSDPVPMPSPDNVVAPLFSKPFDGDYPVLNLFDHDLPLGPGADTGGYQLTWRGERAIPGVHIAGYDSHTGIDWVMPVGTPLFALADGLVTFAGATTPRFCPLDGTVNSGLYVSIGYRALNGDIYISGYNHLSRVDVAIDDRVVAGQQIGLSGATGCVGAGGIPHLHLQVSRVIDNLLIAVDPYGWQGGGVDPWSMDARGAQSVWLWRDGQTPSLNLQ